MRKLLWVSIAGALVAAAIVGFGIAPNATRSNIEEDLSEARPAIATYADAIRARGDAVVAVETKNPDQFVSSFGAYARGRRVPVRRVHRWQPGGE